MVVEKMGPEQLKKPCIADVLRAVERIYGLPEDGLVNADRSFKMAEAGSMAAWAVREMSDDTLTDLGHILGRDVTSLSSSIARLTDKSKGNADLAERMKQLKENLIDFET
ncbi:hypothetical protein KP004_18785 [Geomonas oryzisoli]|uniref:Chromosomal replication initiator DnaA C-terminal domain-containing protein n=1 Tax=Geomonas oryzisoli TaxID=2847992 RepID=A0ABX8J919_9BACT|nr:hypothetical protein [Geomonas oryzisoli]QWV93189.1 hypothetical protein KP004_18785 [Geomonas oryzisoli]